MATTIKVKANQSMQDVAVAATGSMEAAMQFCGDNGVSLTEKPVKGTDMAVSDAALALGDAGALKYLEKNNVEIATANFGAPLQMRVLLRPSMALTFGTATSPSILGYYDLVFQDDGRFVNFYDLQASYINSNEVNYQMLADKVAGTTMPGLVGQSSVLPMTNKVIKYHIPYGGGTDDMLVWPFTATVTFRDVQSNLAVWKPILLLKRDSQQLRGFFMPKIVKIDLVASDDTVATVRIHRGMLADTSAGGLELKDSLIWAGAATGAQPDPESPFDQNVGIVRLTPGKYAIVVKGAIWHPESGVGLGDVTAGAVIEVY